MDQTVDLSIVSWNILANVWKDSEGIEAGKLRTGSCIKTLLTLNADIICLQEYEFDSVFQTMIETQLTAAGYTTHSIKRTHRKPDGLGIFVKKSVWEITNIFPLEFRDSGNRVALLLKAQSVSKPTIQFILCNTHLTFPHHEYDEKMRLTQISKCLKGLREKGEQWNGTTANHTLILVGDFNTNKGTADDVYTIIMNHHFKSSWKELYSREAGVTHRNHNSEDVSVDYVFYLESKNVSQDWFEVNLFSSLFSCYFVFL